MGKPAMPRAQKGYKDYMKKIRQLVDLSARSEIFRNLRATLKGKHQDSLEKNYVGYLQGSSNGDCLDAEKKAIREVLHALLQSDTTKCSNPDKPKEPCGESYRVYELLTGKTRNILKTMSILDIKEKLISNGYYW